MKIGHCVHTTVYPFVEMLMRNLHRPYIHTDRQHDNENLSGSSSIAGGQQLKPKPAEGWTIYPHITISTELPENLMLHYSLKSTHLQRWYFNIFLTEFCEVSSQYVYIHHPEAQICMQPLMSDSLQFLQNTMDLKFKFQIETTGKKLKWEHPPLLVLYLLVNILFRKRPEKKSWDGNISFTIPVC